MEHHSKKILSRSAFAGRMMIWLSITLILMMISLIFGMWGYHHFEHMTWLDALLNAAMILGGMGEIDALKTFGGKIFASFYAIYSSIFLIMCAGVLLVPIFHRVLHRFHADN
ncbi:MAG: hypothetical protein K1X44_07150 [Alphaproteobacteria bacterium]|nr:hypothetical protein [Alphaproteobacteria bacterium]